MWSSKWQQRDQKLPQKRESLRKRIEADLLSDENICGIFYGGSLGEGNPDRYSDIDLRIVVKENKSRYIASKHKRAKRWGQVLFFEDPGEGLPYTVAHYDDFIKVDVFYYIPADLTPSVWLQAIHIVKDESGLLQEIREQSQKLVYKPTNEEIALWRRKFVSFAHEVYRRTMRGELYYALKGIDELRWLITKGWYMEMGKVPNAPTDWAKIEGDRSPLSYEQQQSLCNWTAYRHPQSIEQVTAELCDVFIDLNESLSKQYNIPSEKALLLRALANI
ncbi:aminoglycoside 6-adenylyltransferase [Desmospora activa]|uniref:Streptomycin adenylyltransferase n=1 Tax=Desmospora activa DSM 45169 TaxID=1121389 RepID=A0A2T4ZA25_9BACL|nr:aminoglycoside 6-adenylyltransferase [Desmospora activa]PTM58748.1 streptomycin adenylyltransferase [Desmospora activa DSM 45169]